MGKSTEQHFAVSWDQVIACAYLKYGKLNNVRSAHRDTKHLHLESGLETQTSSSCWISNSRRQGKEGITKQELFRHWKKSCISKSCTSYTEWPVTAHCIYTRETTFSWAPREQVLVILDSLQNKIYSYSEKNQKKTTHPPEKNPNTIEKYPPKPDQTKKNQPTNKQTNKQTYKKPQQKPKQTSPKQLGNNVSSGQ